MRIEWKKERYGERRAHGVVDAYNNGLQQSGRWSPPSLPFTAFPCFGLVLSPPFFPLDPCLYLPYTYTLVRSFVRSFFPHPRKTRTNDDSVQCTDPVRVDLRHAPLSLSLSSMTQSRCSLLRRLFHSLIPFLFLSPLFPLVFPISRFPVICMVVVKCIGIFVLGRRRKIGRFSALSEETFMLFFSGGTDRMES